MYSLDSFLTADDDCISLSALEPNSFRKEPENLKNPAKFVLTFELNELDSVEGDSVSDEKKETSSENSSIVIEKICFNNDDNGLGCSLFYFYAYFVF